LVSATNRDLIADVRQGRFREDLFYRLHVFPIAVPPLRQRPADIPALARHFLALFAAEEGKRIRTITPEAMHLLCAFHWQGNIRQLENAVFRAVVLAEGDSLGLSEFPQISAQLAAPSISPDQAQPPPVQSGLAPVAAAATLFTENSITSSMALAVAADAVALLDDEGNVRPLEQIEAELIRYAVTHYRGQMSEVARRLQIGRSTLYRKLEALGLNDNHCGPEKTDEKGVAVE
jgi:DNA-binding NtrC family response regulator